MAAKAKEIELTEALIDAWRREECLWDVTSHYYTNRQKKQKSINIILEKFDMQVTKNLNLPLLKILFVVESRVNILYFIGKDHVKV